MVFARVVDIMTNFIVRVVVVLLRHIVDEQGVVQTKIRNCSMGLRFHGVHEIVERYAVETIVVKNLQYSVFLN